ncbi:MAG: fructose-bisphosphatase class III [Lachnospiraceae bacterium]|nr:fructose-bisphosphatase class III [Lachnospiraceae bacterium]
MSVYVVSDLHGQFEVFMEGLKEIGLGEEDQLYVIGDAIDRGDDGIRILQYIKKHKNMDLIIGNHELLMLNSVDPDGRDRCNGEDADLWLYGNGGTKTFAQYKKLSLKKRQSLLLWLRRRYVMKTLKIGKTTFCLTHSYYKEGMENKTYQEMEYRDVWNIVWNSMYREEWETHGPDIYGDYEYTFITGHVPVMRVRQWFAGGQNVNELSIFRKKNFIDIDGGCALGYHKGLNNGALFLRLDDWKVFPVMIKIKSEKTE